MMKHLREQLDNVHVIQAPQPQQPPPVTHLRPPTNIGAGAGASAVAPATEEKKERRYNAKTHLYEDIP